MRSQLKLFQIMVVIAIVGVSLALLTRFDALDLCSLLPVLVTILAASCGMVSLIARLKLRYRLTIELAALIALLSISTLIWWPPFYWEQEQRCLELASTATNAIATNREARRALDREAAWFKRKATDLHWRGFWLGLTMGPRTRDQAAMDTQSFIYEMGVLESMEKHEKAVLGLIAAEATSSR